MNTISFHVMENFVYFVCIKMILTEHIHILLNFNKFKNSYTTSISGSKISENTFFA